MTDAYKIGISVALTNLVSTELARIVTHLLRADAATKGLQMSLKTLGGLGVAGGLVSLAVVLKAGVEEARKFQLEATKFNTLGFGDQINDQAQRFAVGMKTIGTSASENMSLVADAMAVFKSLPHAQVAAPLMAQMKFANEAIYGEEGGSRTNKFMDMLKVIEFRGGLRSDEEFKTQADFVQKVINGSRGRVDATQLLNALKTGGVSLAGQGNEAFYLGSEPLIQEFGGMRFGTANMSIYQNLIQMRTTQQALTELMRLGLLDKSKVEMNEFTGKVKRAKPGAFIGGDVLTKEGDLAFLEKVLLPAFRAHGITSDDDVLMELGRILTNRTGSSLLSRVYQQRNQLHVQVEANKHALDIGQSVLQADKTLDGKLLELGAEWKKLVKQFDVLLPFVVKVTGWLVDLVKALQLDSPLATKVGGFINNQITDFHAFMDRGHALAAKIGIGPAVGTAPVVVRQTINLDGRAIATTVTQHQVNSYKTPTGGNDFDLRSTPLMPAYGATGNW